MDLKLTSRHVPKPKPKLLGFGFWILGMVLGFGSVLGFGVLVSFGFGFGIWVLGVLLILT